MIIGLDSLWDIVMMSQDEKVKEDSLNLLCVLHLNLDDQHYEQEQKFEIWKRFVHRCLQNLKLENDKGTINSAIHCLIKFFNIYDGRNINITEMNQSSAFPVHIYCADDASK
jgi:hypothetical protein